MKKTVLYLSILFFSFTCFASSDITKLDGYKYIILPPISRHADLPLKENYSLIMKKFVHKGFDVETLRYRHWKKELRNQPGIGLYSIMSFFTEEEDNKYEVNMELKDIRRNTIYENTARVSWENNSFDFLSDENKLRSNAIKYAIDSVFTEIDDYPYEFDPSKVKDLSYNKVKKTDFTYKTLKSYFKKNRHDLHEIEGFYVASKYIPLFGRSVVLYKVAIVRDDYNSRYNMIVISSLDKNWHEGEVKAELSYVDQEEDFVLNTDYYLHDKHLKELLSEYNPKDNYIVIGNGIQIFRKIYSY